MSTGDLTLCEAEHACLSNDRDDSLRRLAPPIVQMVAIATAIANAMRFIVVFRVFMNFFSEVVISVARLFFAPAKCVSIC